MASGHALLWWKITELQTQHDESFEQIIQITVTNGIQQRFSYNHIIHHEIMMYILTKSQFSQIYFT